MFEARNCLHFFFKSNIIIQRETDDIMRDCKLLQNKGVLKIGKHNIVKLGSWYNILVAQWNKQCSKDRQPHYTKRNKKSNLDLRISYGE